MQNRLNCSIFANKKYEIHFSFFYHGDSHSDMSRRRTLLLGNRGLSSCGTRRCVVYTVRICVVYGCIGFNHTEMKNLWLGSDTLFASRLVGGKKFPTKWTKYPYFLAMTIYAKISDIFVQAHCVVSEHLIENLKPLKLKKPFEVLVDPPRVGKVERIEHDGFNVLYYRPKTNNQIFTDWVYCYDTYKKIINHYGQFENAPVFYEVDGTQDMNEIYKYVDMYIRPVRSDGHPRMIDECKINGIPYYHRIGEPRVYYIIDAINEARKKWQESRAK